MSWSLSKRGPEYLGSSTKRRLDAVGGLALAGVLSPLTLAAGAMAAIDTKQLNPFFVQERVGDNLRVIKFRTIPKQLTEGKPLLTLGTNDPRASHIGNILRRSGMDELPQLFDVIAGRLSLVGPRPILERDLNRMADIDATLFEDWRYTYDHSPKGLTSSASVMRHKVPSDNTDDLCRQMMRLDISDYENASLKSDLRIIKETPGSLLQSGLNALGASAVATS